MRDVAVVFLVFNRPEPTQRVWARIREAQPRRLFVVADGPRPDQPGDADRCAAVRRIVEQVDWPCTVEREYAATNLGCARRVSSGLDWVFTRTDEAIILEDDCVPDPTFFPFCAELLERYRNEPRVAQIAGCTFHGGSGDGPASYYFSRYPHCWGWATWRRAWQLYDHAMPAWSATREPDWLAPSVPDPAERRVWAERFAATASGRVDSWAYRWTWAVWRQGCLSVLPYRNLVSNIGFDGSATHTRKSNPQAALPVSSMRFPLVHPGSITRDAAADERTSHRVFRPPSLAARVGRRLRKIFA
jgi:hypothetical protein